MSEDKQLEDLKTRVNNIEEQLSDIKTTLDNIKKSNEITELIGSTKIKWILIVIWGIPIIGYVITSFSFFKKTWDITALIVASTLATITVFVFMYFVYLFYRAEKEDDY